MSGGIQTQVNAQQAPATAGDWCDGNPRAFVDAGQGALVAGAAGVIVATFGWLSYSQIDNDGAPAIVNNFGAGAPDGFVHRQQQGLITTYLADSGLRIVPGTEMALCSSGGVWATNDSGAQALTNQKAFVSLTTGKITKFAAAGASPTGAGTSTASAITAQTFSATGSINNNVLTLSAVASGTIYPGSTISGTNVATGSLIVNQITPLLTGETVGGVGRYNLNIAEQSAASTAISGTYGLLTIGGTVAGNYGVGQAITGGTVVAGTVITALGTGTGGAGTYIVNNNTAVSSAAINAVGSDIETRWIARSQALPGEIVKLSTWAQG